MLVHQCCDDGALCTGHRPAAHCTLLSAVCRHPHFAVLPCPRCTAAVSCCSVCCPAGLMLRCSWAGPSLVRSMSRSCWASRSSTSSRHKGGLHCEACSTAHLEACSAQAPSSSRPTGRQQAGLIVGQCKAMGSSAAEAAAMVAVWGARTSTSSRHQQCLQPCVCRPVQCCQFSGVFWRA